MKKSERQNGTETAVKRELRVCIISAVGLDDLEEYLPPWKECLGISTHHSRFNGQHQWL